MRYTLYNYDRRELITDDNFSDFIESLNKHTKRYNDRSWDSFWNGYTYVRIWNDGLFSEFNPSDFMIAAYLATQDHEYHELIYGSWVKPGAMGISLDTEDESVRECYGLLIMDLS